ncbi:MAG: N-6 DNA methylase [Paludibacteraceae bacterium]|nr:N-6 DNA methylase [Paludibacteraceae bacterium]
MKQQATFPMLAKTFKGLEEVLAQELIELGANDVQLERRAVSFRGDKTLLYRANFSLRTAIRILVPIASFKAKDTDALYAQLLKLNWAQYMTVNSTFAIDATVYSESFRNSRFVTYRVKDAIVDYWQEREHKRPNVSVQSPDLTINVHIANEQVTLSLDSSGESLHKRGYRVATTEAPINEVLAAGMLRMAGWQGQSDFYDPMCGSGTLLIEAALMARNIAPGVFRQSFAFEKWPDFDADLWNDIYNDDSQEREFTHRIYGSDASFYAIQQAAKNIKSAGVQHDVELKQIRMEEINNHQSPITNHQSSPLVMLNPPYGERLKSNKEIEDLYSAIGTALKHQFTGATAWIISSNAAAMKCIGLKPSKKYHLLNGELDCQFNQYELFQGKRKDNNQ